MNITSVKYVLDDDGNNCQVKSTIDGQEIFVPMDRGNRHWRAIEAWVADGNTIEEAE